MNIFFLHIRTKICASYHVDRHVVKMILETAQLLCTAIWVLGGTAPLKETHKNHPSAIWARSGRVNWKWLRKLGLALCKEYTFRYGKTHKLEPVLRELEPPTNLPDVPFFPPPQAMPDIYKEKVVLSDTSGKSNIIATIRAYRKYYVIGKKHLHLWKTRHAWKNRNIPSFILKEYPEYV